MTTRSTSCRFTDAEAVGAVLASLPGPDEEAAGLAAERQRQLTKPPGSLGRLEEIAVFLASWQGVERPAVDSPLCLVFAGNHGVAGRGVSAYPAEVTRQMVANFTAGGAAINQLTAAAGAELAVHALDLDKPTADFTRGPAMDTAETLHAMQSGADAVTGAADLLLVGEMGIANSTAAAALALAVLGGDAAEWVGAGTGVDDAGLGRKRDAVAAGLAENRGRLTDAVGIMACLGGRELAAIAGAVLEARMRRIPVLVDGFIATAALLPLHHDNPAALDHCLASHCSTERGHRLMLEKLGKRPLVDLDLRLGEGSGAALALPIVKAAATVHSGMATFAEAGVADKQEQAP